MRSYSKVIVEPSRGEIFTAKFAADFGIGGKVMRWQHERTQGALALYNLLIFPAGQVYVFPADPGTVTWSNSSTVDVAYSGSSAAIAGLGYSIKPYDSHPLN
jgi:hypothetical protein